MEGKCHFSSPNLAIVLNSLASTPAKPAVMTLNIASILGTVASAGKVHEQGGYILVGCQVAKAAKGLESVGHLGRL